MRKIKSSNAKRLLEDHRLNLKLVLSKLMGLEEKRFRFKRK